MKALLIILAITLTSCAAHITIKWTDPESKIENTIDYNSARRAAITVSSAGVAVITGQVLINDETVQILGKEAAKVADPLSKGPETIIKDQL